MSVLLGCFLVAASAGDADRNLDNVVLEFSAKWCGPCKKVAPLVSRLKRQGYPIRKIDVDREPELARQFRITSIPAFVVLVDGKELERTVSIVSESRLKRMLARIPKKSRRESAGLASIADRSIGKKSPALSNIPFENRKLRQEPHLNSEVARSEPMATSVRIRIHDDEGISYGSGTVIDSQVGKSLIVTCGHIFRHATKVSKIDVELFDGGHVRQFAGKVVKFDLASDVGLIAIKTPTRIPSVKIARKSARPKTGEVVYSIGCGGGRAPTKQIHRVTALDRYLGPDNIECTGVPEQGRSGGGLFNQKGEIVAVCNAADPQDQRGLYAGTLAVHRLLDQVQLTYLYRPETNRPFASLSSGTRQNPDVPSFQTEIDNVQLASMRLGSNSDDTSSPKVVEQPLTKEMKELVEQSRDAEIVCIIRPHGNPRASSRIVVIHKASQKFVQYLEGELKAQPRPTSHRVHEKRTAKKMRKVLKTTEAPATDSRRYRRSARSRILIPKG